MKIIISLFHTLTTETLYLLDESLVVLKKIKTIRSNNSKGIAIYTDKIIVAQKDSNNDCYLVVYSQEDFSVLNEVLVKETKDIHSVCISGNEIIVVSTGTNEIHYFSLNVILKDKEARPIKKVSTRLTSNTTSDIIHLNGINLHQDQILVSGFGAIKQDSRWAVAEDGFVLNMSSGEILSNNLLRHPHSVFVNGDDLYYCESGEGKIYKNNQAIIHSCDGYVRGLSVTSDSSKIYFGISSRFYKELNILRTEPKIFKYELNSKNEYEVSKSIILGEPGSEIYDIVLLS